MNILNQLNQSTNHLPLHDDVKSAMMEFSPSVNTYSQATGSDELKLEIAKHYGIDTDKYDILLTNGSFEAIHMIIDTLYGTYVNFIDSIPSWPWSRTMAKWREYKICGVNSKLQPEDILENSIVLINNGQNPMGYIYTDDELHNLEFSAKEKNSVILHDAVYWDFFAKPYPLLLNDKNFMTFSFSKGAGLAGLRIGGLVASKENIEKFKNNNPARLGVSVISERVALASLRSSHEWKMKNIETIERNKQRVRDELGKLNGVNFLHNDPIHKMIITFSDHIDCTDFSNRLKKRGIVVDDISTSKFTKGIKEPNVNIISFQVSIPDNWLDEFIHGFTEVWKEVT
jgi:aspartate/methionine/tyrosine aminotransferase